MIRVNNRKTLQQLAHSTYRANRMRNLFVIIAIMLTTVLFTGVFTIAASLKTSLEQSMMRQVGGSAHGGLKYITMEQYDRIKSHESIKEISYTVVLGVAENKELSKYPAEIRYAHDELAAELFFAMPTTGRLPEAENEVAMDTLALAALGIPAQLGELVTLEYSLGGAKCVDTFTLVGYWEGDILMPAGQIWLSPDYVEQKLADYTPTGEFDYVGSIHADVNFRNSWFIEQKLERLVTESGYAVDEIACGVNWAYAGGNELVWSSVLGVALIIGMIVLCGYLIISNIFYIGVTGDIKYYGLLKTIGTTGRQIRGILRRQALWLCLWGIPFGIAAGYLVGMGLTPVVLSILNVNYLVISVHPMIMIFSAVFAVLTVYVSISKPSQIAARVSPIEALRQSDGIQYTRRATRKSRGIHPRTMAWGNVLRNKKKLVLVTLSLSLSLIILNTAYSLADSFDMEKYLSAMMSSDFAVADVAYFNVYKDYDAQTTLTEELLDNLSAMDGVESLSRIYFAEQAVSCDERLLALPARAQELREELDISESWLEIMRQDIEDGYVMQHVYGLSTDAWELVTVWDGELDMEKLASGGYVAAAAYDTGGKLQYYQVGDKVLLQEADGHMQEYEVLAVIDLPYHLGIRHTHPVGTELFLPEAVFTEKIADKAPMLAVLDTDAAGEAAMESFLEDYSTRVDTNMQYESRAMLVAECEQTRRTYRIVGTVLSCLLALIGIMNFANTIITSVLSRTRELAVLQSIGMTQRQTGQMLTYEGLLYMLLTFGLALTAGSGLGCLAVEGLLGEGYLTLHFTVLPSLLCMPLLLAIAVLVPYFSQKAVQKQSVIDRLRDGNA